MPRHVLDIEHYTSPRSFDLERQNLFGKLWLFAGFSSMVAKRNQFFTRHFAGVPVLVQRTDAGIRAFINQCPHRKSAIQTAAQGVRPMVCPYHAWSFGAEGELRGIPNANLYQLDEAEKSKLCLAKVHVQQVGQLIFINLAAEPLPLSEQFDLGFVQHLEAVSAHLDSQMAYSCHRVRYNWKLNMENVKDYNHVPFIHPKTFLPILDGLPAEPASPARPVSTRIQPRPIPGLSALSYAGSLPLKPARSWFADQCDLYGDAPSYDSWYLYPNINFCSISGERFLLQQYDPVSAGETDYHLWVMTARRKHVSTDFTALLSTMIRDDRRVIAEDTQVLEKMQSGFGPYSGRVTHGDYESMLVDQHLWYRANVLGETL